VLIDVSAPQLFAKDLSFIVNYLPEIQSLLDDKPPVDGDT